MTKDNIQYMIESITKDIILLLMDDMGMTMEESFRAFYLSDTFSKLSQSETGLYIQSTPYIYEYLKNEIEKGKMA